MPFNKHYALEITEMCSPTFDHCIIRSSSVGQSVSSSGIVPYSFLHSFRIFLQRLFKSTTTQRESRHSTDTVLKFLAEMPQATASEGLAQGFYVAARAVFEPLTLRMKGDKSTNEPSCPHM